MSGGYLEYRQSDLDGALEEIEHAIVNNGEMLTDEEVVEREPWFRGREEEITDDDRRVTNYSKKTLAKLKLGHYYINMASIFLNRIDYLFDDDDSEESFAKRLDEDIIKYLEGLKTKTWD